MPGRLQAQGFEDCPIVALSHNHQGTPEADRKILYTKGNPAATVRIYVEGGPATDEKICRERRQVGGPEYEAETEFDYYKYGSLGALIILNVGTYDERRRWPFYAGGSLSGFFQVRTWGGTDFLGPGRSLRWIDRISEAVIFDASGNIYYPEQTLIGEYRLVVEEWIGRRRINQSKTAFNAPIEPVTAECSGECPDHCIPFYDKDATQFVCLCRDIPGIPSSDARPNSRIYTRRLPYVI